MLDTLTLPALPPAVRTCAEIVPIDTGAKFETVLNRLIESPTAVWIPVKNEGLPVTVPSVTPVPPLPVCVTVIALLSVPPFGIVAVFFDNVPPWTDKSTVMLNGAPSATLTFTVAGPAASRFVLSVRSSSNVKVNGAPGLPLKCKPDRLERPEKIPEGSEDIELLFNHNVDKFVRPLKSPSFSVVRPVSCRLIAVIEAKCVVVTFTQSLRPARATISSRTFGVRAHTPALDATSTVTAIVCVAVKLPSFAVTVTVERPATLGVIVTVDPETPTVATLALLALAV